MRFDKLAGERIKQYFSASESRFFVLLLGMVAMGVYLWPISSGADMIMTITDNLDSAHSRYYVLANSGKIFADSLSMVPGIMHSLPRISFGSEFNVLLWLYVVFPPLEAYSVNLVMMHMVAFLGMLLLLRNHFIPRDIAYRELLVVLGALLFAFVPFWPPGGLSVAGQPLALYAFLNIRKSGGRYYDWMIVTLLPFYSSFVLAYLFFLLLMSGLWLFDWRTDKRINTRLLIAIALMTAIFLAIEYRLVSVMLFGQGGFVSHREAFVTEAKGFLDAYRESHLIFLDGHINTPSLQFDIVILAVLAAMALFTLAAKIRIGTRISILFILTFLFMMYSGAYMDMIRSKYAMGVLLVMTLVFVKLVRVHESRLFGMLFLLILMSSFLYGFWYYEGIQFIKDAMPFFEKFNFSRFYFLQTLAWYILLAMAFVIFVRFMRFGMVLVMFIFVFQADNAFVRRSFDRSTMQAVSYGSFFAPSVYKDIRDFIGKNPKDYYVVMLGMHPSSAQLNGLQTLDGYVSNYPLAYKLEFRKAIEKELEKNAFIMQRYDTWGSSNYLFSSELGKYVIYKREGLIHQLDINTTVLYQLGGRYLLTQYTIMNAADIGLDFKASFDSKASFWKINLYEINP